jgi:tetratricopeptide (TPR) repeat protein
MMCLGQRLARVEEFVAELEEIDADRLPLVRRTADNLPPLQDCVDLEALARVGVPVDQATQGKIDAAERTLARVQTKIDLGRYNEALELAKQAGADAGAAKNPRVEAKALLLKGTAEIKIKNYEAAEKSLRESLRRADVARDDETRAKGWITLLRLIASRKTEFDGVDDLAADASAALERLGDAPLLWADYYTNLGTISKARNDPDKALEFHAKALEIRQSELGERSVQVAVSRINTANALRIKGEYERAEPLSRAGYEVMRDVLGQWHPYTGTAAFNLVAILGGRAATANDADKEAFFAEMETLLRDALAGNERRMGKDHRSAGTIINNLAQLLLDKKQYELAKTEFERALRVRNSFLPPDHSSGPDRPEKSALPTSTRGWASTSRLRPRRRSRRQIWPRGVIC